MTTPTGSGTGTVYRKSEIVGTSTVSFADAVRVAVARAQKTLRNVQWFEVRELRGKVNGNDIEFQVTVEVGFALEDTGP